MIQNDTKNASKNIHLFVCNLCDFECSKKGDWNRHLVRPKHLKHIEMIQNDTNKNIKNIATCECGNRYKHHSGLWRHKKICKLETKIDDCSVPIDSTDKDQLILMLIKQNSELIKETTDFKTMMMKVIENGPTQNSNNTITNSHNKSFNLNFFLNETCKNAMNINEFIESIKLQLSDLEKVGELGYVEGISNIIVKNLKNLDITQRPVHCTDKKRETMYIKDEDKWEKDEEQKKMHKVVRKVADKNARMLPKFKEAHPDCIKSTSLYSDQYNKIIIEAMGGRGDNDFEKEEKIIKRVSKEVIVDKE
ncbi:MAG: hypothetical protein MUP82_11330 [Candidatus Marinimicrobia bacterium]|nr:hypothetical protein [Candidatus Neomarinimicrobiota bacterium]